MLNLLGAAIGNTWALPFETSFILWLQSLGGEGSFVYWLMQIITLFGEETILVAIVGLVYWGIDKARGERIGFAMISTAMVNPLIKNIVCRTRPFDSEPLVQNLKDVDGYSFPSGHSSSSASTFVGTAVAFGKTRHRVWMIPVAVIIPLLVALSRNYLGAHYLTDVVCGLALGVAMVFLTDTLYKLIKNKYWFYGGILVLGLAGFFYCTTSDFYTGYGLLLGFVMGILFEEKVVKFTNTKVWWRILLRVVVGGALFLGLNSLFKIVMGAIYPDYKDNLWFERIFRTLRYGSVVFLMIGVYPMLFGVMEKVWRKFGWLKDKKADTQSTATVADDTTETNQTNTAPKDELVNEAQEEHTQQSAEE